MVTLYNFADSQVNPVPVCRHPYVVIAHRGDHNHAPENTLTAFENAIKAGADYVEIDLRTSKDSQLMIMHDATVNRMTSGKGNVSDLNWSELEKLQVADSKHPEWAKEKIPLFSDVLALCKGRIHIYLDFKSADVAKSYAAIRQAGMEKELIVYINQEQQFWDWRKIAPQMPLMVSLPDTIKTSGQLTAFLSYFHIDLLDGSYDDYNSELLQTAEKNHVPIWPDIQSADESPVLWEKVRKMGFTVFQTDHPGALVLYLKNK